MIGKVTHGDCLEELANVPDCSIDMVLCDLPYGITRNKWDNPISLGRLWQHYRRVIKPHGVIILFGAGMFSAKIMLSAEDIYRYSLIWCKTKSSGFLNAKKQPLRSHEDILVFYKKQPTFNPQMKDGYPPVHNFVKKTGDGSNYGRTKLGVSGGGSIKRYPTSILLFPSDTQRSKLHPTQKPLGLCEYLVSTYTNPGDVVLDNCAGSGTSLLAAQNLGRLFIGIELEEQYVTASRLRLATPKDSEGAENA